MALLRHVPTHRSSLSPSRVQDRGSRAGLALRSRKPPASSLRAVREVPAEKARQWTGKAGARKSLSEAVFLYGAHMERRKLGTPWHLRQGDGDPDYHCVEGP